MDERDQVLGKLGDLGALGGVRWAHASAYGQLWQDYEPDGGHDQAWVGFTAHKFLINRQDRVFQCGEYTAPEGEPSVGRDVLAKGIADRDFRTMPWLAPGIVVRHDLNASPGWVAGGWRWLMASYKFGHIDKIRWQDRSETKGVVARQPHSADDGGLFGVAELFGLPESADGLRGTLVLAHAMDPDTGEVELFLGRSRWNAGGGVPWVWRENLLALPPAAGGGRPLVGEVGQADTRDDAADARVHVRRSIRADDRPRAIGEA
ncbi:hypothetical protein [Actinokineospora iranica]|uniref:Uncharacterized protein n=1 Tax=Actinokineospora iranica TaxID=1271860 RepID=A0A1G6V9W3_9PSEU|nr:hypothetical protein [Actinokineospora iranica]SDD50193.1 hypothetical protein SAMN05216174_1126 [Actinokineospora iranica]